MDLGLLGFHHNWILDNYEYFNGIKKSETSGQRLCYKHFVMLKASHWRVVDWEESTEKILHSNVDFDFITRFHMFE